ncbi:hypothetical protein Tco_0218721 [Tanacetum coccineum]
MHSDELYKFSDETLTSVRFVLHDIASDLRMDYLPKRRWSTLDKQRSRIMIKAIDKLQLERRLMRNLEKFVGGREYGEDFRLLERIIWLCHILSYSISGRKRVNTYAIRNTKQLSGIEDSHHGPGDAMHNPPPSLKVGKTLVSKLMEITLISIDFLTPRLLILKRRQSTPAFDY